MRFSHNIVRGLHRFYCGFIVVGFYWGEVLLRFYCGFTFLNILPRKFHQSSFLRVIESVDYVLGVFSCDDGTINCTRKKPF